MYKFYNPNPAGKLVGDCVIRGISRLEEEDWQEVYLGVSLKGLELNDMPSSNSVWGAYLRSKGYKRYSIPNTCPDCYTVSQFASDNPYGSFLLATGTHVVAVVDGDYYDAWDSGKEIPVYYWRKD